MSIKDIFIAQGHAEPLGRLDRLDGRTEPPEDFAADAPAATEPPKGGGKK